MSALRMSLHESMQRLVIGPPLGVRQSKNEVFESSILNPILDIVSKLVIPHTGSMKVPGTLECVGIKLPLKQAVNSLKREI